MKISNRIIETVSQRNVSERPFNRLGKVNYPGHLIFGLMLLLWPIGLHLVANADTTVGYLDPNIWLLILLGLISFLLVTALSWYLLQRFWVVLGLPELGIMVLQFKDWESWKQLGFYFMAFVSLLFAGVLCLIAIC